MSRFMPQSIRWRLTCWYALGLAIGLTVLAAAALFVLRAELEERSDAFLRDARGAFVTELGVEMGEYPTLPEAAGMAISEVDFAGVHFFVVDGETRRVYRSPDDSLITPAVVALLERPLGDQPAPAADGLRRLTLGTKPDDIRVFVGAASTRMGTVVVAAARARRPEHVVMADATRAFAVVVPVLLLLAVAGGYLLAHRALAPVADMSQRAHAIGAATLDARIPVSNPHDELGTLAIAFNDLLQRLDAAFAQLRQFTADASHELRSPVAIIRAESDVILSRTDRTTDEYRQSIGVMQRANERLARIVDDLLLLARADSGTRPPVLRPLDLDDVVFESARAMRAVAERRQVALVCDDHVRSETGRLMLGEIELLDRLVLNLLDNAIKFTPAGGTVRVHLESSVHQHVLRVVDDGPGIPEAARPFVFDRFYRVDTARTREGTAVSASSGAGLGLSIVQWIAGVHGGSVMIDATTTRGTTVVVALPRLVEGALTTARLGE